MKPRPVSPPGGVFILRDRFVVPDAVQRAALLRRAGTIRSGHMSTMGPGSAAHHCVLRRVRGTRFTGAW